MTDEEFIARFEDCTLANEGFHHADHVRMAFLYLGRYPAIEALQRFSTSLARHAASKGRAGRYHETITWAFLFLIRERMSRHGADLTWTEFEKNNSDLLNWNENILKKYYRQETLDSDFARRTFVFPDRSVSGL
jgi:hypothetical protein